MKESKAAVTAKAIFDFVRDDNIISFTNCMTRLRLKLHDADLDIPRLKQLPNVLGVVENGSELQIVLGPGFVNKVRLEFEKLVPDKGQAAIDDGIQPERDYVSAAELAKANKKNYRKNNKVQGFFGKVSQIFVPLIPAFIGAGILSGIAGIIQGSVNNNFTDHATLQSWFNILNVLITVWKDAFIVIVGFRTASVFGGTGSLGAIVAALYMPSASYVYNMMIPTGSHFDFIGITIQNPVDNWLTAGFRPAWDAKAGHWILNAATGGIIGAMIAAGVVVPFEKVIRRFMPGALDTILTPLIVLFIMLFVNYLFIIPASGYIYLGVTWLFNHLYTNPFGAMVLAGIFLIALAFGVHQGFIPIYTALIENTGVNGLFPILAMGGCAQVGVALALYCRAEKNSVLRRQIIGTIIPGFLGIGEPLLYGISLPRVSPFICACIGGAVAGFYMGAIYQWGGIHFGMNSVFGPGGLVSAIMMTTTDHNIGLGIGIYLSGVLVAYLFGFIICWLAYSKFMLLTTQRIKQVLKPNDQLSPRQKAGYWLMTLSILGIFIYGWICYSKLTAAQRVALKTYKVE